MSSFFFFNDTATTEIYTLSLHDALPIYRLHDVAVRAQPVRRRDVRLLARRRQHDHRQRARSEEHTSELQSQSNLVCRLLLEKKKSRLKCSSTVPMSKGRTASAVRRRCAG